MTASKEVFYQSEGHEVAWQVTVAVTSRSGITRSDVGLGAGAGDSRIAATLAAVRAATLDARRKALDQFKGTPTAVLAAAPVVVAAPAVATATAAASKIPMSKPTSKPPTSGLKGKILSSPAIAKPSLASVAAAAVAAAAESAAVEDVAPVEAEEDRPQVDEEEEAAAVAAPAAVARSVSAPIAAPAKTAAPVTKSPTPTPKSAVGSASPTPVAKPSPTPKTAPTPTAAPVSSPKATPAAKVAPTAAAKAAPAPAAAAVKSAPPTKSPAPAKAAPAKAAPAAAAARPAPAAASGGKLPLKTAQNVKQTEEARVELLESIRDVVGLTVDVTLDVDWFDIGTVADGKGYNNRVGECVNTLLKSLRDNLKSHCQNEMVKDNIAATWTTGVIRHEFSAKQQYCGAVIDGGDLIMEV